MLPHSHSQVFTGLSPSRIATPLIATPVGGLARRRYTMRATHNATIMSRAGSGDCGEEANTQLWTHILLRSGHEGAMEGPQVMAAARVATGGVTRGSHDSHEPQPTGGGAATVKRLIPA